MTDRIPFHVIGYYKTRIDGYGTVSSVGITEDEEHEYLIVETYASAWNGNNEPEESLFVIKDKRKLAFGPHKHTPLGKLLARNVHDFEAHRNVLFVLLIPWGMNPPANYLILDMRTGHYLHGDLTRFVKRYHNASFRDLGIAVDERSDEETAIFHVFFQYDENYETRYGYVTFEVRTTNDGIDLVSAPTVTDGLDQDTVLQLLGKSIDFTTIGPFTEPENRPDNWLLAVRWMPANVDLALYFSDERIHPRVTNTLRFMAYDGDPSNPLLDVPVLPRKEDDLEIKDGYELLLNKKTGIDVMEHDLTDDHFIMHVKGVWEINNERSGLTALKLELHSFLKVKRESDGTVGVDHMFNIYNPYSGEDDLVSARHTNVLVPLKWNERSAASHRRFLEEDNVFRFLDFSTWRIIDAELPNRIHKVMLNSMDVMFIHVYNDLYVASTHGKPATFIFLRLGGETEGSKREEVKGFEQMKKRKEEATKIKVPRITFEL